MIILIKLESEHRMGSIKGSNGVISLRRQDLKLGRKTNKRDFVTHGCESWNFLTERDGFVFYTVHTDLVKCLDVCDKQGKTY